MINKEHSNISNKRIDDIMHLREYRLKNISLQLKDILKDIEIIWN